MTSVDLPIHIHKEGKLLVNPERVLLLRHIVQTGSLLKASEEIGISYNKAWKMLEAIKNASPTPVIEKVRGGKGGGGVVLTVYGKLILKEYEAIEKIVLKFKQQLNTEISI